VGSPFGGGAPSGFGNGGLGGAGFGGPGAYYPGAYTPTSGSGGYPYNGLGYPYGGYPYGGQFLGNTYGATRFGGGTDPFGLRVSLYMVQYIAVAGVRGRGGGGSPRLEGGTVLSCRVFACEFKNSQFCNHGSSLFLSHLNLPGYSYDIVVLHMYCTKKFSK
jgi:hypothetical protein